RPWVQRVHSDGDYSEPTPSELAAPKVERDTYEELHSVKLDGVTYRVWERNSWTRATRSMQVDYRLISTSASRDKSGTPPRDTHSKAALRRGLASRRSLGPVIVSPSPSAVTRSAVTRSAVTRSAVTRSAVTRSAVTRDTATPNGYQLTLRHSVLWRHELAELLDECGFDVEWGVDEAGEETPFAEQLVVRAVRT